MLLKYQPRSQVKNLIIRSHILPVILTISFIALISANPAGAQFQVVNLVSDQPGVAKLQDTNLVNAWGISLSGTSPFWVSNNGTGTSTLYSVNATTNAPTKIGLTVTIPGAGNVTGQVFNGGTGFNGDAFLFVSEDGTVSGWRGALGTAAETLVVGSTSNSYKGAARAVVGGNAYLLAANFKTGSIDVFKGTAGAPDLTGKFNDPGLPSGFAPFNIQNLNNKIYVTYAKVGPTGDDEAGAGNGFVSVFDTNGNFLGRVGSNGTLNSPWGLALAPASFGALAGDLLVGNFGDGTINIFDLTTNSFIAQLSDADGNPLAIDGLWGLTVGNNGAAGSSNKLYFSAGPSDESHGLFGVLAAVPEPSSYAMLTAGLLPAWLALKRRKR